MSNRRKTIKDQYHRGYLRSPAWFARRARWFDDELREHGAVGCAGCGLESRPRGLELHHLDYTGTTLNHGRWTADEAHDDLVAMHPYCHELLHRLIDRDRVLARNRSRRDATLIALHHLRPTLQRLAAEEVSHEHI